MASTNLDRTAIVKIALFGSVNLKEGMQDISKQLHDFSYSVIDDGNGSQSYKFKIELVNTDESFLKSIVHAYSSMMGNKSGLITQDDVLQSFPKLLIQWGYNNALSKIHTAQLSNLTYKFTQGKEKIIVIEAVNTGNWAEEFFKKAAKTTQTYSLGTSGMALYPVANGKITRNVTQVLMDMMTSLLLTVNGVDATHEFDDEGIAAETDIILKHIHRSVVFEAEQAERLSYGNTSFSQTAVEQKEQHIVDFLKTWELLHKLKTIRKFFKNFGIEVLNKTDQKTIENTRYLPIQEFISKDDTGGYGTITSYLPLSQLKDSSKLGNLEPALDTKAKSEIMLSFNQASSESWGINAVNSIAIYNSRNPLNPISSASVIFKVNIQEQEQNKLKAGSIGNGYIMQATGVDSEGSTINILPYVNYKSVSLATTDLLAGGVNVPLKGHLLSLDYGVQKAKTEQNIDNTFTTEQQEKYDIDLVKSESDISFTQLPPEEKNRLCYTNLEFTLTSPQGYSTLDTVKDIIKKFNIVVSNATNRVSMTEESAVAPGDSFITVWEELNEKPKDITTTVFKIKSGKLASKLAREDLPDIKSFPHINYTPSAGVVEMSYGEANSIVKYFDFNGDLRVLTHILGAVALEQSLENEYKYLNNDIVRTTVLPVLQLLLNEEEFFDQLSEDDSIDGVRLKADIQALVNQLSPENAKNSEGVEESGDKVGISSKFFTETGYITEYINSDNFIERLKESGLASGEDASKYRNTLRFLRSIAQAEGTKALFARVDKTAYKTGNSTIVNYGKVVAGEQLEDEKEVNPTYVYTLVGNNIFDQYYDDTVAQEKKNFLSPNAANIAMDTYFRHGAENWEIKVKTLGIPEMDTLNEISAPRLFIFNVHDLSSEKPLAIGDPFNMHWLSGQYQPLAITHRINKSGYVSEFKLFKNMRLG